MVLLVRGNVRAVDVALQDAATGISKDDGLILALVDAEIRVEESAGIQVADLGLATADDGEEPIRRNNGSGRNLEFGGVVLPV